MNQPCCVPCARTAGPLTPSQAYKARKKAQRLCDKCTQPGVVSIRCRICAKEFFRCQYHPAVMTAVLSSHNTVVHRMF